MRLLNVDKSQVRTLALAVVFLLSGSFVHAWGAPGGAPAPDIVATKNGTVKGVVNDTTITFFGIPFARPPVANLRWQPPQAASSWTGTRDASQFGSRCPQTTPLPANENEDCLFLNVYKPRISAIKLPVMVWIYGGANVQGSADIYNPTPLVDTGKVIAVTINYRIGALGFIAHPALDKENHPFANYGIMDQQLALTWVKNNIQAFGGDPANVTIFGESAGGLNVLSHLISPASKGLFKNAISESGAYELDTPTLAASEALGTAFANQVGCTAQTAACLRALSVATILANQGPGGTGGAQGAAHNQSTIDGKILPESQRSAFKAGRFNKVSTLLGANKDEGLIFVAPNITADAYAQFAGALAARAGKDPAAALAEYPLANYPSPYFAAAALLGDSSFACSARQVSQIISTKVPTYEYEFIDNGGAGGVATHGSEIQYLMNTIAGGPADLPAVSQELATTMRKYWTQFAKTGNPNAVTTPLWSKYQNYQDVLQYLQAPTPSVTSDYAVRHHCGFWG
ncbi:MAG: carboxylesterase family protein [Verrucomicrobiaceae bacterium]|nr:carboxylesterase family protein [Verrucomicrobiaceae bacterium]